jgi:tRNA(fMet)-specific endonuclease VapC
MPLLDSDITTLVFYGRHEKVMEKYNSFPATERLAISVVTRAEILGGRFEFLKKAATSHEWLTAQSRLIEAENWLAGFEVVRIDQAAADQFDRLLMNKKLKKLGRADLLIACIALAQGATLVTRNVKDFHLIPKLKVENWAD